MTALNGRWWYARQAAYTGKRIYLRSDLEEQQLMLIFLQINGEEQSHLDQKDQISGTFNAL